MTNIINLRQARKSQTRDKKEKTAAENRVKHGRTKSEKQVEKLKSDKAAKYIESHKRETDE